jgi:hypothetical protein
MCQQSANGTRFQKYSTPCGASSKEGNIMKKIATALIAATATVLALANPATPVSPVAAPQASNAAAPAAAEKHAKKTHEKKAHQKGETAKSATTPAVAK